MTLTRQKTKGRRESGSFSKLIHAYFESEEYAQLSARAAKLLIDLYCQHRGTNNGDLCAAWSIMHKRGWSSKDQLAKAINELLDSGWITVTRQGGRHCASLYAVTFFGVDPCKNKLDVQPNPVPTHLWKLKNRGTGIELPPSRRRVKKKTLPLHTGHIDPSGGSIRVLGFGNYPATRVNHGGFEQLIDPPHGALLRLYQVVSAHQQQQIGSSALAERAAA